MRVHLEKTKPTPGDHFIRKETQHILVYSSHGIFRVKNGTLIRMKIHDEPVYQVEIDGETLWCDNSHMKDDEEWYQLPYEHTVERVTRTRHLLRACCPVALYTEVRDDGSLKAIYIETDETLEAVADDIRTYLAHVQ